MITCPNCQHENLDGTVFCDNCGVQVEGEDPMVTAHITTIGDLDRADTKKQSSSIQEDMDTWASLHLLDSGEILPLADRTKFTLGRVSDEQPIIPDIDLTPYQAYASGVSRLHAVLKRKGKGVVVSDLGSSNGTFLNGKRIEKHKDKPVNHGDIISLGKLKIQILIRKS